MAQRKNLVKAIPFNNRMPDIFQEKKILVQEYQPRCPGEFYVTCYNICTGETICEIGPYKDVSNNLANFLGIFYLANFCMEVDISATILTKNSTVMAWIKNGYAKTSCQRSFSNQNYFDQLDIFIHQMRPTGLPRPVELYHTNYQNQPPWNLD